MLTDTMHNLRINLLDLGFPSVMDMPEDAPACDYYSTIADAWAACDQTSDDAHACAVARLMIDYAFRA